MNASSKTVIVAARAKARPGQETALEKALRAAVGPTHAEPGCLTYALHRGIQDPRSFLVVERWSSMEDMQRHLGSPHIQRLMLAAPGLLEGAPEIVSFEPLLEGEAEKGVL